ncbi:hypothetical protein [Helicobacter sp. 11S03491-1]|uniref:hypothetical protein n=1 Tax=Helicobacter sp. 11S03491-1 TaxID=1476196 RepID=UPI000BA77AE2|nr:hypothetical protein [Helicobacter sp. 11S03491-1]PAF41435.1 hypothetical protein BKH45_06855 [Helicobacter sp. 11S03491-1]
MIYAPPSGFFGFLFFLFMLYILYFFFIKQPGEEKRKKELIKEKAKVYFMSLPQTKLYLKKGYELKSFEPSGEGTYSIELTLNPNKDPSNTQTRQTIQTQEKIAIKP